MNAMAVAQRMTADAYLAQEFDEVRSERGGLPERWLVDTAADVVLVFRRSSPKAATFDIALELTIEDELTSPLLPGFALPLRDLFAA